jgi:hypothetical protein
METPLNVEKSEDSNITMSSKDTHEKKKPLQENFV